MRDIFVSYRRVDAADVTGRVFDRLKQRFGEECLFKDVEGIPLGSDYRAVIGAALAECKVFLVVIGDDWLTCRDKHGNCCIEDPADDVHVEVVAALTRDIPVIPLFVEAQSMPAADELPAPLRDLSFKNGLPVRPDPDFQHDIERLCTALERYVPVVVAKRDTLVPDIAPRAKGYLKQVNRLIGEQVKWMKRFRRVWTLLGGIGLLSCISAPLTPGAGIWAMVVGGLFMLTLALIPFERSQQRSERLSVLTIIRDQFEMCGLDPSQRALFESTEQRWQRLVDLMSGAKS